MMVFFSDQVAWHMLGEKWWNMWTNMNKSSIFHNALFSWNLQFSMATPWWTHMEHDAKGVTCKKLEKAPRFFPIWGSDRVELDRYPAATTLARAPCSEKFHCSHFWAPIFQDKTIYSVINTFSETNLDHWKRANCSCRPSSTIRWLFGCRWLPWLVDLASFYRVLPVGQPHGFCWVLCRFGLDMTKNVTGTFHYAFPALTPSFFDSKLFGSALFWEIQVAQNMNVSYQPAIHGDCTAAVWSITGWCFQHVHVGWSSQANGNEKPTGFYFPSGRYPNTLRFFVYM